MPFMSLISGRNQACRVQRSSHGMATVCLVSGLGQGNAGLALVLAAPIAVGSLAHFIGFEE